MTCSIVLLYYRYYEAASLDQLNLGAVTSELAPLAASRGGLRGA